MDIVRVFCKKCRLTDFTSNQNAKQMIATKLNGDLFKTKILHTKRIANLEKVAIKLYCKKVLFDSNHLILQTLDITQNDFIIKINWFYTLDISHITILLTFSLKHLS